MTGEPLPAEIVYEPAARRGCVAIFAWTAGRLLVHIFALFLLMSVLCSGFPVAWKLFEKHEDMKVPAMTAAVYGLYRRTLLYWFVALPALLMFDAFVLAALESLPARLRGLARTWFSFVLVAILCFLAYIYAATVVPLVTLTESMPDIPDAADAVGELIPTP